MAGSASRRQVLSGQDGYTLSELLMALAISLLVTAAGATLLISVVRAQPGTTERAGQIQQGRVMLETLTRDLRQGQSILASSPSTLELLTYIPNATCDVAADEGLCRVAYTCGLTSCTRVESSADGTGAGSPRTVVSGITGPNVFATEGGLNPAYVGVTLVFPKRDGEEAVTLEDGVALRNQFEPGRMAMPCGLRWPIE